MVYKITDEQKDFLKLYLKLFVIDWEKNEVSPKEGVVVSGDTYYFLVKCFIISGEYGENNKRVLNGDIKTTVINNINFLKNNGYGKNRTQSNNRTV